MKKLFLTLIYSVLFLSVTAQDYEILSVESLPADFSAREEMKTDHGGHQCALLRIATQKISPEQRERFTFGTDLASEIVERVTRDGEIWLWVSPGLKILRVKHKDWGQYEIKMLDYVTRVEPLHTYKITIRGMEVKPGPAPDKTPKKQFLAFQVTPANATLEVNGEVWTLDASGGASQYMDIGVAYTYRVRATDYFAEEGTVTIDDPANTKVVPVTLRPNSATVTFKVDADAAIWIDNNYKGTRTWTGKLGSRTYKVECRQAGHEPSVTSQEITVAMDGQTVNLPSPTPIYGSLMVQSVPNFCQLFIDGKDYGTTPKSVNEILIGNHEIRLTKEGYADYTETVTIAKGEPRQVKATLQEGSKDEEIFTVNGVSFTMKLVEGGTFQMGSNDSDAENDEKPVHTVSLSSYYMGETEVTQALWKAVMGSNPSYFKGDNLPVEKVSWNDCQEFIRKLNQATGKNFRLPTEAEWEYAARGKTQTSLYNGESIDIKGKNNSPNLDKLAWYGGNCGRDYTRSAGCDVANGRDISGWPEKQYNDSKGGTHPVGKKQPNAYGLYDMLGNVWEWCQDRYSSDYYGKSPSANPQGPSSGSYRVLRGGCWSSDARFCRVSCRINSDPDYESNGLGFRLCLPQ